jgi:hypothetical protein
MPRKPWPAVSPFAVIYAAAALVMVAGMVVSTQRWIGQRREFLASDACMAAGRVDGHGPWLLQLVGEPSFFVIKVGFVGRFDQPLAPDQQREVERIRRLFPEADVEGYVVTDQPFGRLATPGLPPRY